MKRAPLRRRAPVRARTPLRRITPLRRTEAMAATGRPEGRVRRVAVHRLRGQERIDPAHLILRSMGGCGEALCALALCRTCHRTYDRGELDLFPYPSRAQLAHAVGHVGLIGARRRITDDRNFRFERDDVSEP